eukprot:SAG31_NODE_14903_length_781_cov_1.579179_2_plen_138_part_00
MPVCCIIMHLHGIDLELFWRIGSQHTVYGLEVDSIVETRLTLRHTLQEFVHPGRHTAGNDLATLDQALAHKVSCDKCLRTDRILFDDVCGSPLLRAVFISQRPIVLEYVVGGNHFNVLGIFPQVCHCHCHRCCTLSH